MKQVWALIYILLGFLTLWSCDSQPLPSSMSNIANDIQARGIITGTSIPKGEKALFNATGQTPLTDEVFEFNGTHWENAETSIPTGTIDLLTVLYPAYNEEGDFITQNPYADGALQDVLISQNTITDQTNLQLEFKHLFAKLTLHVESAIQERLTEVSLTAPKVTSIHPINGDLEFEGEHTTYLNKSTTGDYTFMIPYQSNCTLKLTFIMANEEVEKEITYSFESGHQYACDVTSIDNRPGIKTIDDLIDFSLFINGKSDKRPWSDFGYKEGEDTVYCLLNDITITAAEETKIANLYPIGYYEIKAFKNIFDGKGHCITNLTIPDKNTTNSRSGLFGYIGSEGIVKNLHIDKAKTLTSTKCKYIGGIAAHNMGLIINCSVRNSTFHALADAYIGGICSRLSNGCIVNSHTSSDTINSNKGAYTGGIAGDANGYILNCYTYKNYFDTSNSNTTSKIGGLVGNNSPNFRLFIANCYVYHLKFSNTYAGTAIGLAQNASIKNFMYNIGTYVCKEQKSNVEITDEQKYESKTFATNEIHISTILNNWIDNTDIKQTYPDINFNIEFKRWTNTIPAVFKE